MSNTLGVSLVKELCLICGKEVDGPIIMNTILTERHARDVEKLHGKVIGFSKEPCNECKSDLDKAFLFIGFDEDKSDTNNLPEGFYRTGHIVGTKKNIPLVEEFVMEHQPSAIKKGYIFIPHTIMNQLGLIKL